MALITLYSEIEQNTNPVLTVFHCTLLIGLQGSGFPSFAILAGKESQLTISTGEFRGRLQCILPSRLQGRI